MSVGRGPPPVRLGTGSFPGYDFRKPVGKPDPVTGAVLAGWRSRAGAWLLDFLVLSAAFAILFALVTWSDFKGIAIPWPLLPPPLFTLYHVALYLGPLLYFWLLIGARGQTLGKMALDIHVRRSDDAGRVSYARALGRAASVYLMFLLSPAMLLSYLWPLWDSRNQTLHDKMAGTIVVRS